MLAAREHDVTAARVMRRPSGWILAAPQHNRPEDLDHENTVARWVEVQLIQNRCVRPALAAGSHRSASLIHRFIMAGSRWAYSHWQAIASPHRSRPAGFSDGIAVCHKAFHPFAFARECGAPLFGHRHIGDAVGREQTCAQPAFAFTRYQIGSCLGCRVRILLSLPATPIDIPC